MSSSDKKHILYINSLSNGDGYRFSHHSETSSLSTAFSIMSLFAMGAAEELSERKSRVTSFLTSKLNEKHQIIDEKYLLDQITSKKHDAEYVINQSTFFSFIALDILGVHFDKLRFLTPFYDKGFLKTWTKKRFDGNFWAESNKLMFLFYFFAYTVKYGTSTEQALARTAIESYFVMLNEHQDKINGYWGGGKSLHRKAYGAAHLYLFYDYFDREIPCAKKIIDSTLLLHSGNGLAETREGGACEDYDLIEIYLRVLKQTDYKRSQITEQLVKMRKTILSSTKNQSGFSYRFFRMPFSLHQVFQTKPPMDNTYSYSSLQSMITPVYYSDCWATFFRVLSLNAINLIVDKKEVPSYGLPGWGFLYRK